MTGSPGRFRRNSLPGLSGFRLDSDVPRMADCVRRARSFAIVGRSYREDIKLFGASADGIKVVLIVPEHLIDLMLGNVIGVVCNRVASIEMKDLQSARARNS